MGEKMRIYVGGLGSHVQDDDLRKTFTSPQLGTVESVEIIRSKGRSFGYLEFVPVSDKGLAKLFSMYNGCMWKGGKLRLERAREHFLFRLRREWTEDAELEIKLSSQNVDADDSLPVLQKPKKDQDIDKRQLNLFFPKLRKIKPIPLKGTGRHKYSFQRVEVPPFPIHFCDCEEHSGTPVSAKRNYTIACESDSYGVNEDEVNMMKSILNKLLEKNCSKTVETVSNEAELTDKRNNDFDNGQVDENEEDQVSDEDNLVINMVGHSNKGVSLFEDWGQKMTSVDQKPLAREPESFSRPISKMHGSEKGKLLPDKKRKQPIDENYSNNSVPSKRKGRKGVPHDGMDDPVAVNNQPIQMKSDSIRVTCKLASSHKSGWKDLLSDKGSTVFHISDVLTDQNPKVEAKPRPDCLAAAPCFNENDDQGQGDQSREVKVVQLTKPNAVEEKSAAPCFNENDDQGRGDQSREVKEVVQSTKPNAVEEKSAAPCFNENDDQGQGDQSSEVKENVQSTKPNAVEEKSARGAAWLQKSSWLQLVGDTSCSAFNLAQILPGVTFQKQEMQHFDDNEFSNSASGKLHKFVHEDQTQEKDVYATPENPTVDVSTKEQNRDDLDGKQSNSGSKQAVEEKDEASVPLHATNLLPNDRAVNIVISETCPFMKSATSMKEWAKTKAALSGSQKKKGKGKEMVQD